MKIKYYCEFFVVIVAIFKKIIIQLNTKYSNNNILYEPRHFCINMHVLRHTHANLHSHTHTCKCKYLHFHRNANYYKYIFFYFIYENSLRFEFDTITLRKKFN